MGIAIKDIRLHVLNMRTRMPFKYGIASLVALPHLFFRVEAEVDGVRATGLSSEGLPPKWFTKNPEAPFSADLAEMLAVIRSAAALALDVQSCPSVFDLWQRVYRAQKTWGEAQGYPPLLWAFGVSLVERASIDAYCRARRVTFGEAVRSNALGVQLGAVHPELSGREPDDLLPARAADRVIVRHTVGLADPIRDGDIPAQERLDDGLPHSLEENIKTYGLTHLKIKLSGDAPRDIDRLRAIAGLMAGRDCAFTLDGNEQYADLAPFRDLWETLRAQSALRPFMEHLLFVEQPLKRDVALSEEVRRSLDAWPTRPPMIIDESDGSLDSARTALGMGYVGTSHKNCKGVFKGIANACLMARRRGADPGGRYELSSEDLANVGPVAMLQDLAVLSNLGVEHSERNGHHYFNGLSMYPADVQAQVLERHGSLYRRAAAGHPTLDVRDGRVDVRSVAAAPFGYGIELDTTRFTPLEEWKPESLEG